jgi:hypothetical protein
MRVIDYYYYLFFSVHRKVFGPGWMHSKRNVLYDATTHILMGHIVLLALCMYELGIPLNLALTAFLLLTIALYFYTTKRFLKENYFESFSRIQSEPKNRRRLKLLITAFLFPIHLFIYLNIHR